MARPESPAMVAMREQVAAQLRKARAHFEQGKQEFEAGNIVKASSAVALAISFDPKNTEFQALHEKVQRAARKTQASHFVAQAESAEGFANLREALAMYRKAIDYGTESGKAYYRAVILARKLEEGEDKRASLDMLRKASRFEPDNADVRFALGLLYIELDLKLNARRELEHVLKVKKDHPEAKEALKRVK
jgi:tetratricopeptide (TPR) repeat protein